MKFSATAAIRVMIAAVCVAVLGSACTPAASTSSIGAQCTSPPTLVAGAKLYGCNLSGLNLSGLDLRNADFHGANLVGADLHDANLSGANFEGANLTNANLAGANLAGAILAGAILLGASFLNAILVGASFDFGRIFTFGSTGGGGGGGGGGGTTDCDPYCAGYNEASIDTGVDICDQGYGAQYGLPNFYLNRDSTTLAADGKRSVVTDSNTDFIGAVFNDIASLTSSGTDVNDRLHLRGMSLSEADFTDAFISAQVIGCKDLTGARFDGATFFHAELIDLDFMNATLVNSKFSFSTMCSVDFSGSDLNHVKFWGDSGVKCTDLGADLVVARPAVVVFDGADLSSAQFGELGSTDSSQSNWATMSGWAVPAASFQFANMNDASSTRANFTGDVFTGAALNNWNATQSGIWESVNFMTTSWAVSTFQGSHDFANATCPDGSTGSAANPCFTVVP